MCRFTPRCLQVAGLGLEAGAPSRSPSGRDSDGHLLLPLCVGRKLGRRGSQEADPAAGRGAGGLRRQVLLWPRGPGVSGGRSCCGPGGRGSQEAGPAPGRGWSQETGLAAARGAGGLRRQALLRPGEPGVSDSGGCPCRYVQFLSGLLSGAVKMNTSPVFLHCVVLHGTPSFDAGGGECPQGSV